MANWYYYVQGRHTNGIHHDNSIYWDIEKDKTSESGYVKHLNCVCWLQIAVKFSKIECGEYIFYWKYRNPNLITFKEPKLHIEYNGLHDIIELPASNRLSSNNYNIEALAKLTIERVDDINISLEDCTGTWKSDLYIDYFVLLNVKFFMTCSNLQPTRFKSYLPFYIWINKHLHLPKYLWQQNILSHLFLDLTVFSFFGQKIDNCKNY